MVNSYIFREYDIRGIVDKDLTDEVVDLLGKGFGTYLKEHGAKKISIGGDIRLSTERFLKIMIQGIRSTGIDVINIGLVPTPVQYFSMFHLKMDGGVMITGSHNPPDFNGFKLSLNNTPIYGKEIQTLRKIIGSIRGTLENGLKANKLLDFTYRTD